MKTADQYGEPHRWKEERKLGDAAIDDFQQFGVARLCSPHFGI